jgi:hypothetical protein
MSQETYENLTEDSLGESPVAPGGDTVDTVVNSVSPSKSPVRKKGRPRGIPFNSETGKAHSKLAANAKALRKKVRKEMLDTLVTELNLGDELVRAIKNQSMTKMNLLEKAIEIVGLKYAQSPEVLEQKLHIESKSDVKAKVDNTLHFTITEAEGENPGV